MCLAAGRIVPATCERTTTVAIVLRMSHFPTVVVDRTGAACAWGNRRLERPDPARLSHDGPGLATTRPQGRHDRSDFSKKCGGLSPFRVLSLEGASPVQHPPAARLRRRLTEDHIGALGRQSFLASTCDRRAAPSWRRSLNRGDRRRPRTRGRRR
jgi:hypothetical protein